MAGRIQSGVGSRRSCVSIQVAERMVAMPISAAPMPNATNSGYCQSRKLICGALTRKIGATPTVLRITTVPASDAIATGANAAVA